MPAQDNRPTPTIEDYLGIMYVLERDGDPIVAARLAESLEVSAPTVTVTLKRMVRDGWIVVDDRKGIELTPLGRVAASSILRRHMLTEWMLARALNVPWSQIHAEAHHIEHTISDQVEARMLENYQDPQLCPHGNPLPGYEHLAAGWLPLTRLKAGARVIIRRIHENAEEQTELMRFLEAHGVFPGAEAVVEEVLSFNQTITLKIQGQAVSLGNAAAQYIFVEPIEEQN